eukprot:3518163-Rhodomonas_salina.3
MPSLFEPIQQFIHSASDCGVQPRVLQPLLDCLWTALTRNMLVRFHSEMGVQVIKLEAVLYELVHGIRTSNQEACTADLPAAWHHAWGAASQQHYWWNPQSPLQTYVLLSVPGLESAEAIADASDVQVQARTSADQVQAWSGKRGKGRSKGVKQAGSRREAGRQGGREACKCSCPHQSETTPPHSASTSEDAHSPSEGKWKCHPPPQWHTEN